MNERLSTGSIDKWLIFSLLREPLVSNIRIACVFGCSGNEAIFVTKDDEVMSFGSNCSLCLGLGETVGSLEPRRVDVLSKKQVIKMAFGSGPHVVALTATGDVWTWGHNTYHQVLRSNIQLSSNSNLCYSWATVRQTRRRLPSKSHPILWANEWWISPAVPIILLY